MRIRFLYYAECPSHEAALARLRQVMAEEQIEAQIELIEVATDEQAQALRFVGSPTILVDERDIDPPLVGARYALTCRAYRQESGRISPLPSSEMIRRSLRAAADACFPPVYDHHPNGGRTMARLKFGDKAIPFTLIGVDNEEHSLVDYGDRDVLVLIFSCNHCPYVRAWEDRMVQIQADYAARGVQLVAISANDAEKYPDDSFPRMQARAREKGFNFPYLYDESQQVARAYGAERTPEVFVFDKERGLRYHGAIDDNYENPAAVKRRYLRDALDAVLAGKGLALSETPPVGCTIKWK